MSERATTSPARQRRHPAGAAHVAAATLSGEQRRRQALMLGIATLVLLGFSPVLTHHVADGLRTSLDGVDHVGQLCVIALHLLLAPVHTGFHLLLGGGLAYAAADRLRAWWRMRRALQSMHGGVAWRAADPRFVAAARRAGLDERRLRVVDQLPNPAFTAGWWRPTVYAAAALADRLTTAELAAVVAHEAAHARRRDPLRLSALRFAACALFWIPALRRLTDDMADEAEVLADDAAAGDDPLALASALVAVAGAPSGAAPLPGAVVGFTRPDLLARRVGRLLGERVAPASRITRGSLAGALATLTLVWLSSAAVAHPLPSAGAHADAHCENHAAAMTHLFCRHGAGASSDCPHRHR
jgi:Zn-dependent protease with chaperone function